MFGNIKNKIILKKAVFKVKITFNENYGEKFAPKSNYYNDRGEMKLTSTKTYNFSSRDEKIHFEQIKMVAIEDFEKDLLKEINNVLEYPANSVEINGVYEGSIEIVFSVLFNAYQFIAGIKDFFDSLKLISNTSNRILRKRLTDKYGDYFNISTEIEYPTNGNDFHRFEEEMLLMRKTGRGMTLPIPNYNEPISNRDAFFYYLLFSNIILTLIIIFLVWKALVSTYHW